MTSIKSSPKRIEKVSSDNIVISFDLLSNLTYMASLAIAELPRDAILKKAGEQKDLKTAVFFEQVNLLAQRLGVEYTRALQLVAAKARASNVKSLLLRFASTIATGESEHTFIREETRIEANRYAAEYDRSVENLRKWTDAYAALLVSVTLIVVVALVSSLLGALEQSFIVMVGGVMFMITSGGVWVILRTAPYEQITYDGDSEGPRDRATAKFFLRTLGPLGALLALTASFAFGVGYGFIAMGVFLFPAGYFAKRDDKKVRNIDGEVATFVRSLGTIAGAKGTTLTSALNSLDLKSMGSLEPHILRLRTRLTSKIPTHLCWDRFKEETGNELLRRSSDMLVDGIELGASGEEVGEIASSYASTISRLREVRNLTSSSFSFLLIPMHAAMTGLLLFILQIVILFDQQLGDVVTSVSDQAATGGGAVGSVPGMDLFQSQDLTLITGVITMVILVLTVTNAMAPQFASGGHILKLAGSLSTTCLISGIAMLVVPMVAGSLLVT